MTSTDGGPDGLDVLTNQDWIKSTYGGAISYGLSASPGKGSVLQLTASWCADRTTELRYPVKAGTVVTAVCQIPANRAHNIYGAMYRAHWALGDKILALAGLN